MLSKGYITDEEILMREKGDISLEDAKRILKQNRANMPDQPEEAMDGEVQG